MPASLPDPSPIDDLPRPLAIVAHDAGAANMIASWCAAAQKPPEFVCANGPAAAIFSGKLGPLELMEVDEAVAKAACVLSGTGWASDLEHDARVKAAKSGVVSLAVIDHWVNYPQRFSRGGEAVLPDRIIVGDQLALKLAAQTFPATPAEHWPNLYLAEQIAQCGPLPDHGDTLFVAEPARSDWGKTVQGEFQALDWFADNGAQHAAAVRLRPHPSDAPGKYDSWLAGRGGWSLDTAETLASAIAGARHVAGMNSMAMIVALEAGRQVTCAIPPWGPECLLPHPGIGRLGASGLA